MMDKCRLTATGKDDGRGDFKNIDLTQEQHDVKPSLEGNSQQENPAPASIATALNELLPAAKPMRTKKKAGALTEYNYFVHWVRIKPEHTAGLAVGVKSVIGHRYIGCIVVSMDYEKTHILGNKVEDLSHAGWVRVFTQLGVFDDVPEQLDLDEETALCVTWETNPDKYFYRNAFVLRHWSIIRFKEENEHLKMNVLSLTELVNAAEENAAAQTE
jgi:hypothetical protein